MVGGRDENIVIMRVEMIDELSSQYNNYIYIYIGTDGYLLTEY